MKKLLSAILSVSMLISSAVIPVKAEPMPIPLEASRIDAEKLPEGNLIYMGTAAANLDEEDAVYEFPIYREGDLSKGASVTIHTLDMTAVYGKDYEIVDEDVEETGDKQSLLEMSVTEGLKESDEDAAQAYDDAEMTETADKINKLPANTKVEVLEQKVNGWSRILYDNAEGFIKSEYLSIVESAKGVETIGTVTATANVNVRAAASETAEKLGVAVGGETLDLIALEGDWCKVVYNGQIGYVKAEFVSQN